jgi:hypothetical protein
MQDLPLISWSDRGCSHRRVDPTIAGRLVQTQAIISLNDERGTGGQSRLARLLDWHHSTVWRKLTGKSPITESDALAIQRAVEPTEVE